MFDAADAAPTWHFFLLSVTMLLLVVAILGPTTFLAVDYWRDRRRRLLP